MQLIMSVHNSVVCVWVGVRSVVEVGWVCVCESYEVELDLLLFMRVRTCSVC